MRARLIVSVLAATLALSPGSAQARRSATRPQPKVEEPAGMWTSAARPDHACSRVRRKFWEAAEGWVVRRVAACR